MPFASSRVRALGALGAVVLTCLAAPPLRASTLTVTPIVTGAPASVAAATTSFPILDPCAFDPPTLAKCNDKTWRASSCGQQAHGDCVDLLQAQYRASFDATTSSAQIMEPSGMSHADTLFAGKSVPYDPTKIRLSNVRDLTFGSTLLQQRSARTTSFGVRDPSVLGANTAAVDPYENDSTHVNTCAEYTYKKWYDYNRFGDAAASCNGVGSCVYDLAMLTSVPGLNHPLHKRTALPSEPMPSQLPSPTGTQIKNPWYTQTINVPSAAPGGYGTTDARGTTFGLFNWYITKHGGGSGASTATLIQGAYAQAQPYTIPAAKWPTRWAWHQAMHDAQKPYALTRDDYADIARRTGNFMALLNQFAALDELLLVNDPGGRAAALHPSWFNTCGSLVSSIAPPGTPTMAPPSTSGGTAVGGDPGDLPPIIGGGSSGGQTSGSSSGGTTTKCVPLLGVWTPPASDQGLVLYVSLLDQIGQAIVDEWSHVAHDGKTVDHGCIDPTANRCDWSPDQFAAEYTHLFQDQMEKDFKTCVYWTGNAFNYAQPPIYASAQQPTDYSLDADTLEAWYAKANLAAQQTAREMPWTGPKSNDIGGGQSGGHKWGDDGWASVDYSYGSSWTMKFNRDANQVICGMTGEAAGHLTVNAHILGAAKGIFDGGLDVVAGKNGDSGGNVAAHLTVLDITLLPPSNSRVDAATAFHYAYGATKELASTPTLDFPICGINVTISASANLDVGIALDASANGPAGCTAMAFGPPPGATNFAPLLTLQGKATPYAGVTVSVVAAIDEAIIQVGVRGDLNLITASVPMKTQIGVAFDTANNNSTYLTLANDGSLDLSELSGDVKAFGEVCLGPLCDGIEIGLFSWDGLHQTYPIFHNENHWALLNVNQALGIPRRVVT